jgi:hypothetical protein
VEQQHDDPSARADHEPGEKSDRDVLIAIRDALLRQHRQESQEDFSLLKLLASLFQMLSAVAAIWGLMAIFSGQPTSAIARLALAVFLQLIVITVRITDRRT